MSAIDPKDWSNIANTGKSMNQLGDEWWKRAYAIPLEENPFTNEDITDPRGRRGSVEKANIDQPDPIFFLGGSFALSPEGSFSPVRTIVIPEGAVLVFATFTGALPDAPPIEDSSENEQEIRLRVNSFFQEFDEEGNPVLDEEGNPVLVSVDSTVTLDDVSVGVFDESERNTEFRRESPSGGFSYTLPENNIQDTFGQGDVPAQTIPLAVADGYWFAFDTDSLSPGEDHTVNFTVDYAEGGFELDVNYNILNPEIGTNKSEEISGTPFNDYIVGNDGKDTLTGGDGDDLILGGKGEDIIDGGRGSDELWGDEGEDKFIYRSGYGEDTIFDFSEEEIVELRGFEEFDDDDFEDLLQDITLPSGVNAAEINFGNGDVLKIVGVRADDLEIDDGQITFDD